MCRARRRARFVLLAALWLPLLSGCQPPASSSARASQRSGVLATQRSPEYREAVRRFARKDYPGALASLDTLLAAPGRTPAEKTFLQRQRVLCQSALLGKPVAVAATPSAAPAPPRATASAADCGPRALLLACQKMDTPATLEALRRAAGTTSSGTSLAGLTKAAKSVGLKARGVQMDRDALARLSDPAVAWVEGNHYVAVLSVEGETATVHDPNKARKEDVPLADLLSRSGGILLTLKR